MKPHTTKITSASRIACAILALFFIYFSAVPSAALTIRPSEEKDHALFSIGDVSEDEAAFFGAWKGELQIRRLIIGEVKILVLTVIKTSDESPDYFALDRLMQEAEEETWFDYDRYYVDQNLGETAKRESVFDIDIKADTYDNAAFPGAAVPDPDENALEFSIGEAAIVIQDAYVDRTGDKAAIVFELDMTNTGDEGVIIPYWNVDVKIFQDDVTLMQDEYTENHYLPITIGQTKKGIIYRATMESESEIRIEFYQFGLGEDHFEYKVDPATLDELEIEP